MEKDAVAADGQRKRSLAAKRSAAGKRAAATCRGNQERRYRAAWGRRQGKNAFLNLAEDRKEELARELKSLADHFDNSVAELVLDCNRKAREAIISLAKRYGPAAVAGAFKANRAFGRIRTVDLDTESIADAVALEMRLKPPERGSYAGHGHPWTLPSPSAGCAVCGGELTDGACTIARA